VDRTARTLITGRALRGFVDGSVAVLLPAYLLALGHSEFEVGLIGTVTLAGSAVATLAVGAFGHRAAPRTLLLGAALLMAATGLAFASFAAFVPLLVVAFVGTLNPGSGDVSVFLPLEHARLAASGATSTERTALFARYSLAGALAAALGALAAGLPDWVAVQAGLAREDALRGSFVVYGAIGLAIWALYRRLPMPAAASTPSRPAPLGPSRGIVVKLSALFAVDAFAGGLVLNSLLSLWLMQHFGLSLAQAGLFFFATGLLAAASQLAAPVLARRIGLVNTMVFTHLPANVALVLAALAPSLPVALLLLGIRALLSQMDVPTRTAYVMSVVTPPERPAAASFTAVPRSLAAAASPALAGALFAGGWLAAPMVLCGVLKIAYDLTLWRACRGQPLQGE
jgi:MFS family permease